MSRPMKLFAMPDASLVLARWKLTGEGTGGRRYVALPGGQRGEPVGLLAEVLDGEPGVLEHRPQLLEVRRGRAGPGVDPRLGEVVEGPELLGERRLTPAEAAAAVVGRARQVLLRGDHQVAGHQPDLG